MSSSSLPQLPDSGCGDRSGSVPVFSCVVILRTDPQTHRLCGRVANLPGISADSSSERDLLILLTKRFKSAIQNFIRQGQEIPWIDPPPEPEPGEQQRFIPIHL